MTTNEMVAVLDAEIERLNRVRELLAQAQAGASTTLRTREVVPGVPAPAKRVLSPEARERIAAAQRARWAARSISAGDSSKAQTGKDTETGRRRRGRAPSAANTADAEA